MPDLRALLAIALTLTFAHTGIGRTLPFDTSAAVPLLTDLVLFGAYIYLLRTVARLPFALVITWRRARYAHVTYGLRGIEALRDGLARGLLDTRRWTVGPLAQLDRLALVAVTLLATTPFIGPFVVRLGGIAGIALLLLVYLARGSFSLLVDDGLAGDGAGRGLSLPFLNTRD